MPRPNHIELPTGEKIPILYEDRSVLAIDKPPGWMLVPFSWQNTSRNLQAALTSSIAAGDFWARSRGLKYLRFVHRLDAGTTGILLLAKSQGAVTTFGALFETRRMHKLYLAVVQGIPAQTEWSCSLKLAADPTRPGAMKIDSNRGKAAQTHFRVLQKGQRTALVEAHPLTGRTHQIRVHLAAAGHSVMGDDLYGSFPGTERVRPVAERPANLGLRAVRLSYQDPFTGRRVQICAPIEPFVREYGFALPRLAER